VVGSSEGPDEWEALRPRTKLGREKVLKYRGEKGRVEMEARSTEWMDRLMAEERASGGMRRAKEGLENKAWSEVAR
jgi:hypothetical protein